MHRVGEATTVVVAQEWDLQEARLMDPKTQEIQSTMSYDAEHILREKYPAPRSQEREHLRQQGDRGLIGGALQDPMHLLGSSGINDPGTV